MSGGNESKSDEICGIEGGPFPGKGRGVADLGNRRAGARAEERMGERDGRAKIALARRRPMPDGVTSLEGGIARASESGSRRDMTRPMGLSFFRQRGRRDPGSKSKEKKKSKAVQ